MYSVDNLQFFEKRVKYCKHCSALSAMVPNWPDAHATCMISRLHRIITTRRYLAHDGKVNRSQFNMETHRCITMENKDKMGPVVAATTVKFLRGAQGVQMQ